MTTGKLLQVIILTFSGFAVGGALSLVFLPAHHELSGSDRLERAALDAARLGFAIMVALISEALYHAGTVEPDNWRVWIYTVGAVLAGSGYFVLAIREVYRRRKGKQ